MRSCQFSLIFHNKYPKLAFMCLNLYQSRQNKLPKSIQNKTKQKTSKFLCVFINSILPHIFLLFLFYSNCLICSTKKLAGTPLFFIYYYYLHSFYIYIFSVLRVLKRLLDFAAELYNAPNCIISLQPETEAGG